MGTILLGSLVPEKYVGCDFLCVVGWIGNPNWLRDFNRETPVVNLS